jgi:ABC-type branched-subunit amino acid transport system substrate-binding protein
MGCPTNGTSPTSPVGDLEIGTAVALTGDLAGTGKDNTDAANLAVEQINEQGGVLGGRKLKLVVEDDRTTVDGARAAFTSLIARHVPVVIGPSSSKQVREVADLIAASRTLTIGRTSTSTLLTTLADNDYFFRVAPSDVFQGKLLARLVQASNVDRVCIVHRKDTYGTPLADAVIAGLAPTLDIVRSSYGDTEKDLSKVLAPCNRLLCSKASPDAGTSCSADAKVALLMVTYVADGAKILASGDGWSASKQHFFFSDGSRDNELVGLGLPRDQLDGAQGTLPSGPDPTSKPGAQLLAYQNAFRARYHAPAPAFSETAFEAVYLAAAAIELAGKTSSEAARDALRQLANPEGVPVFAGDWKGIREAIQAGHPLRYSGVMGPAAFDANGDRLPPYYYRIWRIEQGSSITSKIETVIQ